MSEWDIDTVVGDSNTTVATVEVPASSKLRTFASDAVNITVRGRLGSGVELRTLPSGSQVGRTRLAVTRRGRDDAGNWHDASTTWYTVKMWGQLAHNAHDSLEKGQPVIVTGRLDVNEWDQNGSKGTELLITALSVGHDLGYGTSEYRRPDRDAFAR
ncbi:MAG: single-stranded DNA-binding protein [Actinomycetaceae bacterium]|nr:single-stranded DNA-binding protein [Actinomycetaceae bacterium]